MWKEIDWQLVHFVMMTSLNDYWIHFHLPRIHYYDIRKEDPNKKAA